MKSLLDAIYCSSSITYALFYTFIVEVIYFLSGHNDFKFAICVAVFAPILVSLGKNS